jgi:hypothetical protein
MVEKGFPFQERELFSGAETPTLAGRDDQDGYFAHRASSLNPPKIMLSTVVWRCGKWKSPPDDPCKNSVRIY